MSRSDYTPPVNPVRFPACDNRYCTDIAITNDNILEQEESFTVSLMRSEGIGNEIRVEPDVIEIIIHDEDSNGMFMVYL